MGQNLDPHSRCGVREESGSLRVRPKLSAKASKFSPDLLSYATSQTTGNCFETPMELLGHRNPSSQCPEDTRAKALISVALVVTAEAVTYPKLFRRPV